MTGQGCRFTSKATLGILLLGLFFMLVLCDFSRCPTTDGLDLIFYNKDHHNWGFKFSVPKFQTYDELYLFCDIYLCDMEQETKPHCDRSCSRSATPTATPTVIPSRRKRVVGRRVLYSRNSASSNPENGHIEHGPFLVKDDGFGPLINDLGQLVLVAADKSGMSTFIYRVLKQCNFICESRV